MFDIQKIIREINISCKGYFLESTFYLNPRSSNRFIITGNNSSTAINNYNNNKEEVSVIKWFDDFWLYIDIRFEKSDTKIPNTFITFSVFQGENDDIIKNQLFRAEWDNFENNEKHPQPHWHVYSDHNLEKTFSNFIEMVDENNSFTNMISEEKSKGIDLKKIHFAMNGLWSTNGGHIHKIENEETIINWFQGLLSHIKSQLEYVK
jgi:hypothetical protein